MISDSASISQSNIGNNCKIYKDVLIDKSVISDNVVVGDNSIIIDSRIGNNSKVNRRVNMSCSEIEDYVSVLCDAVIIQSKLGMYTNIGYNTILKYVDIGKYTSISWNCSIGGANHDYKNITTHPFNNYSFFGMIDKDVKMKSQEVPLTIGNDVWIASNVVIMRGCSIGDGAVLGGGGSVHS